MYRAESRGGCAALGNAPERSLSHDLPGRVADRDGAATDHDIGPVPSRRPLPLLALALLGPFLGDALDGVDDGRSFHDRTTTLLLPRSRYSTRGYAACSTKITGSSASTLCRERMLSRLMPKGPSERNGLRMPGNQFTPVTSRRPSPSALSPSQPKAVSMTKGMPSSS